MTIHNPLLTEAIKDLMRSKSGAQAVVSALNTQAQANDHKALISELRVRRVRDAYDKARARQEPDAARKRPRTIQ